MKGREWYQDETIVESYEDKRFSRGGGRLTDSLEKQAVFDALAPVEGKEILEIACGTGRFTVMLAERGAEVVGLDISTPMLGEGRRKARRAGVVDRLAFLRGDASRLPFPRDSFDAVFAARFFHLADTPEEFLSEMVRVSRSRIVFDTYNRFSGRSLYNWALPMGSRLYSRREVERLLEDTGLHLVREDHDFVLPFGLYRKLPGELARGLRLADEAVGNSRVGDRMASISYWTAEID